MDHVKPNRVTALSVLIWGLLGAAEQNGYVQPGASQAASDAVQAISVAGIAFGLGRKVEPLLAFVRARLGAIVK